MVSGGSVRGSRRGDPCRITWIGGREAIHGRGWKGDQVVSGETASRADCPLEYLGRKGVRCRPFCDEGYDLPPDLASPLSGQVT